MIPEELYTSGQKFHSLLYTRFVTCVSVCSELAESVEASKTATRSLTKRCTICTAHGELKLALHVDVTTEASPTIYPDACTNGSAPRRRPRIAPPAMRG
jgi:hypothetical protein